MIQCCAAVPLIATALCVWCKQCLPGARKAQRAPSPHCRDARVYGHTTTTMHDITGGGDPPPPRAQRGWENNPRGDIEHTISTPLRVPNREAVDTLRGLLHRYMSPRGGVPLRPHCARGGSPPPVMSTPSSPPSSPPSRIVCSCPILSPNPTMNIHIPMRATRLQNESALK